jgi:hypothetical protein
VDVGTFVDEGTDREEVAVLVSELYMNADLPNRENASDTVSFCLAEFGQGALDFGLRLASPALLVG